MSVMCSKTKVILGVHITFRSLSASKKLRLKTKQNNTTQPPHTKKLNENKMRVTITFSVPLFFSRGWFSFACLSTKIFCQYLCSWSPSKQTVTLITEQKGTCEEAYSRRYTLKRNGIVVRLYLMLLYAFKSTKKILISLAKLRKYNTSTPQYNC